MYMPIYAMTFVWSSEVQSLYTSDPIKIGLYNFPAGFGAEVGALVAALLVRRIGRTNLQLTAACLFLTIFTGLMATLTPNSIRPALGYMSIGGFAIGFIQVLSVMMIQFEAPDKDIGDATGILISFRTVGAALGGKFSLSHVVED
jgi:predicted MFS family arabinose efflux permease